MNWGVTRISTVEKSPWGNKIPSENDLKSYCDELMVDFDSILQTEVNYLKIDRKTVIEKKWHRFIHEMAHHYVDGYGSVEIGSVLFSRSSAFIKPWYKVIFAFEEDVRLWSVIFAKSKQLVNPLDLLDRKLVNQKNKNACAEVRQWRDLWRRQEVLKIFNQHNIGLNNYKIKFDMRQSNFNQELKYSLEKINEQLDRLASTHYDEKDLSHNLQLIKLWAAQARLYLRFLRD